MGRRHCGKQRGAAADLEDGAALAEILDDDGLVAGVRTEGGLAALLIEATNPEIAAAADPNAMTRWINGYCLEHPGEPLATATKAYLQTEGGIVSGD